MIFSELDVKTGGLISLCIPTKSGETLNQTNQEGSMEIQIMNKKMVSNPELALKPEPYPFKVLEKGSIVKSVGLQSNFDSDYILVTPNNIEKGTSNDIT